MTWDDKQYDRVARYLDGEPIKLSAAEQELAQAIARQEHSLGDLLAAAAPASVMDRARRRMIAALARPRWRVAVWAASSVAVAAAVLVAASVLWWGAPPATAPTASAPLTADVISEAYTSEYEDMDIDLIEAELAELQAEMVVGLSVDTDDTETDMLDEMLDMLWLEEAGQNEM